jgi:hypothetical protein
MDRATYGPCRMICKAKTQRGTPCRAPAIRGGAVCQAHRGSAPQVIAAARMRHLQAADSVAARLVEIASSKKTEPRDAIAAIREVLNRAGLTSAPESAPSDGNGQVLWDEFVAMYRRRSAGGAGRRRPSGGSARWLTAD